MAAKDLGNKHLCYKCSTKFYDLKKPDPICPKCGADQRESPANRPPEPRRGRLSRAAAAVVPVPEPAEEPAAAAESEDEIEDFEEEATEAGAGEEEDV